VTLRYCIAFAYGVKEVVSGVRGLRGWRNSGFDYCGQGGPAGDAGANKLPEMMQALLAQRLQVQVSHGDEGVQRVRADRGEKEEWAEA